MRVDVVSKCKDRVLKPRVPLQGNLNVPHSLLALEVELLRLRKDLWVGQKADGGPGSLALLELARLLDLALWEPTLVALGKEVAISPYLHLEPLREGVYHGRPNTMQTAGDLVALSVELPAGMQGGHDDLGRRLAI